MKCPECNSKIGPKNYDAIFEWYECPNCEGCFTGDEIVEAEIAAGSRGTSAGSDSRRSSVRTGGSDSVPKKKVPAAKGKKRKAEIDADAEAIAEYEKKTTEVVVVAEKGTKHRDEVRFKEVVNIMADEIVAMYDDVGEHIDDLNAKDKATTLWRNLVIHDGIKAREKSVPMVLCKDHA